MHGKRHTEEQIIRIPEVAEASNKWRMHMKREKFEIIPQKN